jgi:cytochrome c oxidase cbb3-type subunit 3
MSDQNDKFHEYDGIIEHDNPLPNWWLWSFLLSIIFGSLYFLHYEISGAPTLQDELKVSMAQIEKLQAAHATSEPAETEQDLEKAFDNKELLAAGGSEFQAKCAACHGQDLQGVIGPNLTDKYWLHGKGFRTDIVKVIREGVADKGMPPWGPILKKQEIHALAAFIYSKRGSNPAGAKAPQGDAVEDYLQRK